MYFLLLQEYNTKTASCHAIHYYQAHTHSHPHPHPQQRYQHSSSNNINIGSNSSSNSSHKQPQQKKAKSRYGHTGHHSRHYKYDAVEECCRPIFHEHYGSSADMLWWGGAGGAGQRRPRARLKQNARYLQLNNYKVLYYIDEMETETEAEAETEAETETETDAETETELEAED